jgi:hypothetical protein
VSLRGLPIKLVKAKRADTVAELRSEHSMPKRAFSAMLPGCRLFRPESIRHSLRNRDEPRKAEISPRDIRQASVFQSSEAPQWASNDRTNSCLREGRRCKREALARLHPEPAPIPADHA